MRKILNKSQESSYINKESENSSKIFWIKQLTKGKTNNDIKELVRGELGITENDATIWDKIIKAISGIKLNNSSQSKSMKLFYWIICLIIVHKFVIIIIK